MSFLYKSVSDYIHWELGPTDIFAGLYYLYFWGDPLSRKCLGMPYHTTIHQLTRILCLVCVVFLFEWAQTILTTQQTFSMYFSNPFPWGIDIWVMAFLMPAFTAATVQVFLVWRITVIAQRRLFAAIVLPVSSPLRGCCQPHVECRAGCCDGILLWHCERCESPGTDVAVLQSAFTKQWIAQIIGLPDFRELRHFGKCGHNMGHCYKCQSTIQTVRTIPSLDHQVWLWSSFVSDILIIAFMMYLVRTIYAEKPLN